MTSSSPIIISSSSECSSTEPLSSSPGSPFVLSDEEMDIGEAAFLAQDFGTYFSSGPVFRFINEAEEEEEEEEYSSQSFSEDDPAALEEDSEALEDSSSEEEYPSKLAMWVALRRQFPDFIELTSDVEVDSDASYEDSE